MAMTDTAGSMLESLLGGPSPVSFVLPKYYTPVFDYPTALHATRHRAVSQSLQPAICIGTGCLSMEESTGFATALIQASVGRAIGSRSQHRCLPVPCCSFSLRHSLIK